MDRPEYWQRIAALRYEDARLAYEARGYWSDDVIVACQRSAAEAYARATALA